MPLAPLSAYLAGVTLEYSIFRISFGWSELKSSIVEGTPSIRITGLPPSTDSVLLTGFASSPARGSFWKRPRVVGDAFTSAIEGNTTVRPFTSETALPVTVTS